MSISTQGGGEQRRPSVVSTGGKKPTAGDKSATKAAASAKSGTASKPSAATKPAGKPAAAKPGTARRSGGPRKPVTPVKVTQGRNWGPIMLFIAVGVIAIGIVGYGGYAVYQGGRSWEDKAATIDGIINYRKDNPAALARDHKSGSLTYAMSPPAGGNHNSTWQNCTGNVYDAPIANEHAVHSLEHGAVWVTYNPSLPAEQVEKLASKVRGIDYTMMSPYTDLDKPISLQAWGYQLKVDNAEDARIDEFIKTLRLNATMEAGATCSQGVTATGTTPHDLGTGMESSTGN